MSAKQAFLKNTIVCIRNSPTHWYHTMISFQSLLQLCIALLCFLMTTPC